MDKSENTTVSEYRRNRDVSPVRLPKWPVIAGFWLVQSVAVCTLVAFAFHGIGQFDEFLDTLTDTGYLLGGGIFALAVAVLQAAFVLPVRRHETKADPRPSWWRLLISAWAVGWVVAFPSGLIFVFSGLADALDWHVWEESFAFQIAGASCFVAIPVMIWMKMKWKAGIPVTVSLAIAGLVCGLLLTGATFLAVEGVDQWRVASGRGDLDASVWEWLVVCTPLVGWAVGTPLLLAFRRGKERGSFLARVAARLFIGTVIEVVATIPLDFMVRKRTSCYCGEGTFFTLVICGTVGAIMLGPAIYLLPLGRRRQRLVEGRCPVCGYDMSATPKADACPECGAGWKPASE